MRSHLKGSLLVSTILLFSGACGERATEPQVLTAPSLARGAGGNTACPTHAEAVVTDEAELLAALDAANPGDVIALDGFFEITARIVVRVEDLTLTCATPGSGLFAESSSDVTYLLLVLAAGVAVDQLELDGSETRAPYYAGNNGTNNLAEAVQFTNNRVVCGRAFCAFLSGVAGAVFTDNEFTAAGTSSGIYMQGAGPRDPDGIQPRQIDGSRVLRNKLIATTPPDPSLHCGRLHGGMRIRDGSDVVVAQNIVQGPWLHSVSPADLSESRFEGNSLDGAACFGFGLSFNRRWTHSMHDNVFRNNRVADAEIAGIYAASGCGNVFLGNNLQRNADGVGAMFDAETGANTLVGNANVVIDNGDYDCDGDEVPDPNIITGRGAVLNDVNLGSIVSDATSSGGNLEIH